MVIWIKIHASQCNTKLPPLWLDDVVHLLMIMVHLTLGVYFYGFCFHIIVDEINCDF